jgi:outer membrane protein OmpA-like peptidoglycan-associated protein
MRLKGHVNTNFHESSPAITPDGKHLYFTATHRVNTGKDGIVHLGIFRATHKNGKWKRVRNLSINGNEFNNAHPSLTNDGKTLYFVSDREGGIGQTDLYKVAINENGSLGEPVNLGPEINTPGRESFPYSDGEKGLYFSSDGYLGLGGYDIYFKDLTQPQNAVISLGRPINSNKDDYAFHLISENGVGFFSSNRGDNDDIYQLTQLNPINKLSELVLYGTITGEPHKQTVAQAQVRITNENGSTIVETKSDNSGEFMFKTPKQAGSTIRIEKDGFKVYSQILELARSSQELMVQLQESDEAKAHRLRNQKKSLLLAALMPLNENPISFPFEKTALSDYEKTRLDALAEVLKQQSNFSLVILGHTDTRGSKHYNLTLSKNRALAAKTYLVSKGVTPTNLKIQGRGEEEPIKDCKPCKLEEHQKNRRLQFRLQE